MGLSGEKSVFGMVGLPVSCGAAFGERSLVKTSGGRRALVWPALRESSRVWPGHAEMARRSVLCEILPTHHTRIGIFGSGFVGHEHETGEDARGEGARHCGGFWLAGERGGILADTRIVAFGAGPAGDEL